MASDSAITAARRICSAKDMPGDRLAGHLPDAERTRGFKMARGFEKQNSFFLKNNFDK